MGADGWLLAYETDAWRVGRCASGKVELRKVERGDDETERLAEIFRELDYDGRPVCLGLPSDMVFCAEIETHALPRRRRYEAMLYRLEEHLPLDAEDVTADFVTAGPGRALGVAVKTKPVADIIESLTQAGLEVGAVRPTALLALHEALLARNGDEAERFVVIASDNIDMFRLSGDRPAAWESCGPDAEQLCQRLRAELLARRVEEPVKALVAGEPPTNAFPMLERELGRPCEKIADDSPLELATRAAASALSDGQAGWVELRRGELSESNPWTRFGAAVRILGILAVLLPTVLTAGMLLRSQRYEALAQRQDREQQNLFSTLYPNQQVPLEVRGRLASEHRRLAGVSGSDAAIPARPCALEALRQVVAHLPGEIRLRIEQVRIDPDVVLINGQARGHGDAERICQSLRQAGFQVGSPRTESLVGGGVSFTITASRTEPDEAAAVAGINR